MHTRTPVEAIRQFTEEQGGVTAAAKLIGVKPVTIYHVLNGVRGVSKSLAEKIDAASGGKYGREFLLWGVDPAQRAA